MKKESEESELKNVYENLNDEEKVIIYVVGSLDNTPLRSRTKLQKVLFLVSNVFKDYKDLLEFEPHLFGPYSETIDYVLEDLIKLGLINQAGNRYELTDQGKKIYSCLKPNPSLIKVIEDFKQFLNDLSDDEVLVFVYVSYPEFIKESAKWEDLKEKRVNIAISLLKKQKISFGKAVQISGLKQDSFEGILKKNNIKWRVQQ